jgi:alpha/beta superfamily hydrolase
VAGLRNFFLVLSSLAVAVALIELGGQQSGLVATVADVQGVPVTVLQKSNHAPAPAVVIAHGFSGSQQLMAPLATTLAQNGYVAVTFDFSGHGRNARPLSGGIGDAAKSTEVLVADVDRVVAYARALAGADGRVALAGHSMATDVIVRAARRDATIAAVVALSFFAREVTPESPKNLLIVDGAWESQRLIDVGADVVSATAGGPAQPGVTYGDVARGAGRRLALARGAEHIGVLYSYDAHAETLAWLNSVFGRSEAGFIDRRGLWLALLFGGLIALARPLAALLPALAPAPLGAGLPWRRLAPRAIAPALLTPLLLWKAPTDFMPILLGDYLTAHLGLYGLLTAAGIWATRVSSPVAPARLWPAVACSIAVAAYYTLALGVPLDAYVVSFAPTMRRLTLLPVIFAGCAAYFLADEWLTRGQGAARGGYAFSKFCFVASLALAVALNPRRLFFLVIISIVVVILLAVYGLVGHWVYARTRDPLPGALGAAFGLAWAIAVCFPIVD